MSAAGPSRQLRRMQWIAIILVTAAIAMNYMDRSTLAIGNLKIREEFGISATAIGALGSAWALTYGLAQLPSGYLLDRVGPKLLVGLSMIVWSLFQAAGGLAGSYFQLMLSRIGLGATEAPCFPSATRSVSDWFDVKHRGTPSGVYTSGAYIGPTLAPPILTGLMLAFNWRVMFIVMGLAGIAGAAIWFLIYRDPRSQALEPQDAEYLRANREAKSSVTLREWTSLFRFRAMWVLMLGAFCTGYITWMYQTWLPAYLEMQQHISIGKTGLLASVPLICAFFGALSGGWVSDRLVRGGMELIASRRLPLILGLLGSAVFTGLAAVATGAGMAVICIAISMFCMQFGITCKWILVTAITPQAYCASAASNQNFAGFLGGTLSPVLTGFIVDVTGSFVVALAIGAVITLIGAALFQFFMTTVIDEGELEKFAHAPA
ncbi:MAG TPA: MFS transporter [Acetobacteraceae bacterium]|jgi:MFS family permease|nr:MFS transporter [Acetobacteraceae bacterium]